MPGETFVRSDLALRWAVDSSVVTVRADLAVEWTVRRPYTGYLVARDLGLGWQVLPASDLVRSDMELRWKVGDLVRRDLSVRWAVVEEFYVRSNLSVRWRVSGSVRSDLAMRWNTHTWQSEEAADAALYGEDSVEHLAWHAAHDQWRPAMAYPICQLNGITLHVVEFDPGGEGQVYDKYEHYDGSIRLHNMRGDLFDRRVKVRVTGTTPSNLDSQEEAIKAACAAGGSFTWQSLRDNGSTGPVKSDAFAPSDQPSFERDQEREALFRSYATLVLRMWPA